jgi:peroxiredoxin
MVHLQSLYEKCRKKGLVVLGFNSSDDRRIALEMLRENSVTFPNILDASDSAVKTAWQEYRSSGVPLNYIIDREGKIADAWYGYEKGHKRALTILQKLGLRIKMPPQTRAKTKQEKNTKKMKLFQHPCV